MIGLIEYTLFLRHTDKTLDIATVINTSACFQSAFLTKRLEQQI